MRHFSNPFSFIRKYALGIIAGVFLALLLISTWFALQKKTTFDEGVHLAIQEEFQKVVKAKILEKNPLAEDIQFHELWTETTDSSSQIRAVFSYSFSDPAVEDDVRIKGSAVINRRHTPTDSEEEKWEIDSFDVSHTEINFNNEVLVIAPDEDSDDKDSK